jgi:hypothetical protein
MICPCLSSAAHAAAKKHRRQEQLRELAAQLRSTPTPTAAEVHAVTAPTMSAGAMALSSGVSRRRAAVTSGSRRQPGLGSPASAAATSPTSAEQLELLGVASPPPPGPARPTATAPASTPATPVQVDDAEQRFEALAKEHERLQSELAAVKSTSAPSPPEELLPQGHGARDVELGPVSAWPATSTGSPEGGLPSGPQPADTPGLATEPELEDRQGARKRDDVPAATRADLGAHLDEANHEDVSVTLEPPTVATPASAPDGAPVADETADEEPPEVCPSVLRGCMSAICTSCIWMAVSTLWDVLPWLVPFGMFMRSLSLRVESGVQMIVLLVFLATPIISMRYHGNSDTQRHSLGDGWNIVFVGLGTLLTISFVQVFLFILYEDIDSFFDLQLEGNSSTVARQNATLSDPLEFGLAIFKAEFLPEEFNEILDKHAFGKVFLAAPPAILLGLVLVLNVFSRLRTTKIANDSLSSELYSCGYFLWFYSLWLLLLHAESQPDYYADYSVETMKTKVSSVDSVETVSYLTNCAAFIFMSFSIAVQEASGPTRSTDMAKSMETKYFSSNLGYEGMFWLLCMWLNGTIAIVTTFVWTYQRQTGSVFPFFAGLLVSLMYVCMYWYHVVWWYSHLHTRHRQVTDTLTTSQDGSIAAVNSWWRRLMELFSPESNAFYSKQSLVEAVELISQSYRSWFILVIASSGRFGSPSWHWVVVVAFAGLVCSHGTSCLLFVFGVKQHSPYTTLKISMFVDMMYVVGGVVASIILWSLPANRGMPLCAAFRSDWLYVLATVVPLIFALWSLPTAIVRSAIFMSNKRPAQAGLRRIFDAIDTDGSGSLDADEIGKLCENMGAKLTDKELELAMRTIDKDGSDEVSFDEFCEWIMTANKGKVATALSRFRASGLRENAMPPLPTGCWKWFYTGCVSLAICWSGAVIVFTWVLDFQSSNFFASMDEGEVSTTLATFESTFESYSAAGIEADQTASFLVLDKYTALRFEDIDIPAGATVIDATLSFVPYIAGKMVQTEYCTDTNNLGSDLDAGIAIASVGPADNTIEVAATDDLQSVAAGQKLRLVDATGQECPAAPKKTSLVVASVADAVITFSTDITATDASAGTKCRLKRATCTSPMQIDQGRLRVTAQKTKVDMTTPSVAKPESNADLSQPVEKDFEGGQNFAISGIEATISEVIETGEWAQGNTIQLYLELLSALGPEIEAQARSAACEATEPAGSSCFFPKQLMAADCDSPLLTISYQSVGEETTTELSVAAWPHAPEF